MGKALFKTLSSLRDLVVSSDRGEFTILMNLLLEG